MFMNVVVEDTTLKFIFQSQYSYQLLYNKPLNNLVAETNSNHIFFFFWAFSFWSQLDGEFQFS